MRDRNRSFEAAGFFVPPLQMDKKRPAQEGPAKKKSEKALVIGNCLEQKN
tara:strand:- start:195 stop:344 length:150 start_codon:yes stop_codon:yes gene_type:complete